MGEIIVVFMALMLVFGLGVVVKEALSGSKKTSFTKPSDESGN